MPESRAAAGDVTRLADELYTVSYVAHIAGALMGCLVGVAILKAHNDKYSTRVLQRLCNIICTLIVFVCLSYVVYVKVAIDYASQ